MAQQIINGEVIQTTSISLQEFINQKQNELDLLQQEVEQKKAQIEQIIFELKDLLINQ